MMSMAMLPMESIEMIFREMVANEKRLPLFVSCQELLLLIATTFPVLLTHPHTIEALLKHIKFGVARNSGPIINNTLQILAALQDPKPMHEDKKTAESEHTRSDTEAVRI